MAKIGFFAERAIIALILVIAVPIDAVVAQSDDASSCGYFTTDPDDRAGPPIHFYADMWDGPQRAPTESPGVGRVDFVLERDTLKLSWTATFKDLTSEPIGMHVHGPVPAEGDAPAIFDLATDPIRSPLKGEKILSLGEVAFFVQHLVFVNLHTTKYPAGELRGSIRKLPPKC